MDTACAGEAGSHAGESPAGRIRRFTTERDAREEAARRNLQAGHLLNRQAITKVNPHPMSIENASTGKPSRCRNGEGCQGRRGQPSQSAHRSGGVSGDGMSGRATGVTREVCPRGAPGSTPGTTPSKGKAGAARAEDGVLHSSEEAPVMGAEQRRGSCADACEASRERGDGLQGLVTPTVPGTATGVRKLQRTLYRQAKSKPQWKTWSLYGDVCRRDVLEAALRQVAANGGAPGVDGVRVKDLAQDTGRRGPWLAALEDDLRRKTYRPSPVRRVMIPKADGKQRPLGIPTVRDRVVQTTVVFLLLPIFEADFHEKSYAYRPKRRAQQAVAAIEVALLQGRREVVDADLSGYFDTIPHAPLSRMREIRSSGSMRGKEVGGHWPCASHPVASFPTLLNLPHLRTLPGAIPDFENVKR